MSNSGMLRLGWPLLLLLQVPQAACPLPSQLPGFCSQGSSVNLMRPPGSVPPSGTQHLLVNTGVNLLVNTGVILNVR